MDEDPVPDRSRHLAPVMIDCLLPHSIAIPITDEKADVLETVRLSVYLAYHEPGTPAETPLRTAVYHHSYPTDAYLEAADLPHYAGSQMALQRDLVRMYVTTGLAEMDLHLEENPIIRYMARWYMAPLSYNPTGVWEGDGSMIYRLGSVNFTGYAHAVLGW